MKQILTAMILALAVCSGCSDDGGDGDGDGDGDDNGSTSDNSSSGEQTCVEDYSCVNGACQCDGGPNQGQSCCDPDDDSCTENKCNTFCKRCS
jgi:hypothetical protein